MNEANPAQLVPYVLSGAFLLAFVFGAVGHKTSFCTMGAVADWVNMGDSGRMRMWVLAIAVAILGANALHLAGLIDLSKSFYQGRNFTWLSYLAGGFAFGIGMTLASGCGSKTLIRIGGGNLKSVVVFIVIGLSAYMTLRGLFGAFRAGVLDPVAITLSTGQDLPSLLAGPLGLPKAQLVLGLSLAIAGGLLAWVFASRDFRCNPDYVVGGLVTGLVVAGAWYVSGHVGHVAEHPDTLEEAFVGTSSGRMESFSFVAPLAYTLEYLMLWTDKSRTLTFGIAVVAGVIAGSAAYALAAGRFRWEGFRDAEDTANHLVGATLMGFGGVTAMGCTIGQGLSGLSTLALGSMLAFAAMVAGSVCALKYQYWRLMQEP
jgi:uncharacterized membrane protein YedE/YeeE